MLIGEKGVSLKSSRKKMKVLVFLEYTFLFAPAEGWSHLYEFEHDLARFFSERGFEADIFKTIEGQGTKRILYLKRKEPIVKNISERPQPGRPKTTKGIIRDMSNRPLRKAAEEYDKKRFNMDKPFNELKK